MAGTRQLLGLQFPFFQIMHVRYNMCSKWRWIGTEDYITFFFTHRWQVVKYTHIFLSMCLPSSLTPFWKTPYKFVSKPAFYDYEWSICSVCLLSWWIGNSLLFAKSYYLFSQEHDGFVPEPTFPARLCHTAILLLDPTASLSSSSTSPRFLRLRPVQPQVWSAPPSFFVVSYVFLFSPAKYIMHILYRQMYCWCFRQFSPSGCNLLLFLILVFIYSL